jgi:hypothetical protein
MSDPKVNTESAGTVRVRIAVAAHPDGRWSAAGSDFATCRPLNLTYRFRKDAAALVHLWVEAVIPLPLVPQTIQGTVTEAS